jgi:hypothetical protein
VIVAEQQSNAQSQTAVVDPCIELKTKACVRSVEGTVCLRLSVRERSGVSGHTGQVLYDLYMSRIGTQIGNTDLVH